MSPDADPRPLALAVALAASLASQDLDTAAGILADAARYQSPSHAARLLDLAVRLLDPHHDPRH